MQAGTGKRMKEAGMLLRGVCVRVKEGSLNPTKGKARNCSQREKMDN